jgi:hypothetical protein
MLSLLSFRLLAGQRASSSTISTPCRSVDLWSDASSLQLNGRVDDHDRDARQNRFYLHGNAIANLQTTIPVLLDELRWVPLRTQSKLSEVTRVQMVVVVCRYSRARGDPGGLYSVFEVH